MVQSPPHGDSCGQCSNGQTKAGRFCRVILSNHLNPHILLEHFCSHIVDQRPPAPGKAPQRCLQAEKDTVPT